MPHENAPKVIRYLLIAVLIVIAVGYIYRSYNLHESSTKIPSVAHGNAVLFTDEMSDVELVSCIDASEQSIFFSYSRIGVVAVYDWNGRHQYSLAFFSDTNGGLGMRCKDNLLYVSDHENYEFVFSGNTQLEVMSPSEVVHSKGWYNETRELPIEVRDDKIYDKAGRFIMDIPGKLDNGENLLVIFGLLILSVLSACVRNISHIKHRSK